MKKTLLVILIFLIGMLFFINIYSNRTNLNEIPYPDEKEPSKTIEEELIEPKEKKTTATILAVGDIMFHAPQIKAAYIPANQTYDFSSVFQYVKKYIDSADIAIGNFETVTYGNEIGFFGFPRFNSPVETLEAIKDAGFDILNTANNHALDQGREGLINTIDYIQSYGMKNIGTYKEASNTVYIEEVEGIKLAFMSYCYGFNGLEGLLTEEEQDYMVSKIDEEKIKSDIEFAKSLESDAIIIFIHWGNEYQREPSAYQVELGRKMIEWGANIILGTHPHVIQKSEIIEYGGKNNFIIYSMGNFLSNQREVTMGNRYTEDGIMVEIELEKDLLEEKTIIKDIRYIPTWVRRYEKDNNLTYSIIPIEEFLADEELKLILKPNERIRINESFEDTMEVMSEFK